MMVMKSLLLLIPRDTRTVLPLNPSLERSLIKENSVFSYLDN